VTFANSSAACFAARAEDPEQRATNYDLIPLAAFDAVNAAETMAIQWCAGAMERSAAYAA
jgi:hypothetical protein